MRPALRERLEEAPPRRERLGAAVVGTLLGAEPEERPHVGEHPVRVARLRHEGRDSVRELAVRDLRRVRLEHTCLCLRHLAERPEADALPVRQAAALAPGDQLGQLLDDRQQLRDEPALAHPGNPDERDELRLALPSYPLERAREQHDLVLPADELREWAALDVHADTRLRLERLPRRHRLGLALGVHLDSTPVADRVLGCPIGRLPDEDAVDGRGGLESSCRVDHIAGDHRLARRDPRSECNECLAGVDGDSDVDGGLSESVADRERRANGALWIVLVRNRGAEHRHHGVADELLDRAAVSLELRTQARVVGGQDRPHLLGVVALGLGGRADEIREEDGHHLPLLQLVRARSLERRPAARAERSVGGALLPACRTDQRLGRHRPSIHERRRAGQTGRPHERCGREGSNLQGPEPTGT